jgi:hypothetical protein
MAQFEENLALRANLKASTSILTNAMVEMRPNLRQISSLRLRLVAQAARFYGIWV